MANTVMSAKNTFAEGLVMDFAPDNTQATTLTSALNATLLTFNGNEMSLQNDMGNGRVETAYLPEGYVPVGTCEFGDIIYIVSYNPITNKSQIGCFPSPERNISSEEIGGKNQILSNSDFVGQDGTIKSSSVKKVIFDNSLNPGDKYIVYSSGLQDNSNNITDYGNSAYSYGDWPKLLRLHIVAIEDSGKINYLDSTVKWYNNNYFIQDNGSANNTPEIDIDSYRSTISSAYSIFQSKVSGRLAILAELEKISGFSCTHNIYVTDESSGQKGYHVYLNMSWDSQNNNINPKGFVVTKSSWENNSLETKYLVYDPSQKKGVESAIQIPIQANTSHIPAEYVITSKYDLTNCSSYKKFKEEMNYNAQVSQYLDLYKQYSQDPNYLPRKATLAIEDSLPVLGKYYINAYTYSEEKGFGFTKSNGETQYLNDIKDKYLIELDDAFVHNYFSRDVTKHFFDINLTSFVQENNTKYYSDFSNLVYQYEVCPAMPYGYLQEYAVNNSIDFNKVGSGLINLSEWRYYNDGDISTLSFGLDAYPEDNKGISKVILKFFDNNGATATLKLQDKNSYSGSFTEIITFNSTSNKNLSGIDSDGTVIKHKGNGPYKIPQDGTWDQGTDQENLQEMLDNGIFIQDGSGYYYENDSGILYPNLLYLVEIQVYYQSKNAIGEYDDDNNITPITFTRWFWTNAMFNDYYFNTQDYKDLKINLDFSIQSAFQEIGNQFQQEYKKLENNVKNENAPDVHISLSALGYNKYEVSSKDKGEPNLRMALVPSIEEDYNTFTFTDQAAENLMYHVREGKTWVSVSDPGQISSDNSSYIPYSGKIAPNPVTDGLTSLVIPWELPYPDNNNTQDYESWIGSLEDGFNLHIIPNSRVTYFGLDSDTDGSSTEYVDFEGTTQSTDGFKHYTVRASDTYSTENTESGDFGINMSLIGQFYSKITANTTKQTQITATVYKPFIQSTEDLDKYNIGVSNIESSKVFVFKKVMNLGSSMKNAYFSCSAGDTNLTGGTIQGSGELNVGIDKGEKYYGDLSTLVESTGVDVGIFSMISAHATTSRHDGKRSNLMELHNGSSNEVIYNTWRETWGTTNGSGDRELQRATKNALAYTDEQWKMDRSDSGADQLMIRKAKGTYLIPNVFWRPYPVGGLTTQRFGKLSGGNSAATQVCGFTSMAQLVASTLAQTYYRANSTKSIDKTIVSDIIINNDYQEIWKKDFVISIEIVPKNNDEIDASFVRRMFNISRVNFQEYVEELQQNYNKSRELIYGIGDANITIEGNFDKQVTLVQFQHTLQYDISELNALYSAPTLQQMVSIESDITGIFRGKLLPEANYQSRMFLDLKTKQLQPFSFGIAVHRLMTDEEGNYRWNPQNGYNSQFIKLGSTNNSNVLFLSAISDLLTPPNNETTYAKDVSYSYNIYKACPSSDDWNEIIFMGFNRQTQISKYFAV